MCDRVGHPFVLERHAPCPAPAALGLLGLLLGREAVLGVQPGEDRLVVVGRGQEALRQWPAVLAGAPVQVRRDYQLFSGRMSVAGAITAASSCA